VMNDAITAAAVAAEMIAAAAMVDKPAARTD
jgi:hypothetical protein